MDRRLLDDHLASLTTRVSRKVNNRLTGGLRTVGLSLDAWLVLRLLMTEGPKSMGEIAEILVLNLPTLTKLIDRMVSDNLVYRKPSQADRRVINIFPSDAGVIRYQVAWKIVKTEHVGLSEIIADLDLLMEQLSKLIDALDDDVKKTGEEA